MTQPFACLFTLTEWCDLGELACPEDGVVRQPTEICLESPCLPPLSGHPVGSGSNTAVHTLGQLISSPPSPPSTQLQTQWYPSPPPSSSVAWSRRATMR